MKTHWLRVPGWWTDGKKMAACRPYDGQEMRGTENPDDVTCLKCQKAIEDDMKTLDEVVEENAQRKAKQRARSRAVTELVDRHPDEFQRLWRKHTDALLAETREDERRWQEMQRKYDQERLEAKRKELLAQLEALG